MRILSGSASMLVYFVRRKVVKVVAMPIGDVCIVPSLSRTLRTSREDPRLCRRTNWCSAGCSPRRQSAGALSYIVDWSCWECKRTILSLKCVRFEMELGEAVDSTRLYERGSSRCTR